MGPLLPSSPPLQQVLLDENRGKKMLMLGEENNNFAANWSVLRCSFYLDVSNRYIEVNLICLF